MASKTKKTKSIIKVIVSAKAGVNTEAIDNKISDLADKCNVPLDVGTKFPKKSNFSRAYEFVTSKLSRTKVNSLIKALEVLPEIDERSLKKVFS